MSLSSTFGSSCVRPVEKKLDNVKIPEDVTFIPFCLGCERKDMRVRVNQRTWSEGRRVRLDDKIYQGVCTPCWNSGIRR